jgi:hypothetical protein
MALKDFKIGPFKMINCFDYMSQAHLKDQVAGDLQLSSRPLAGAAWLCRPRGPHRPILERRQYVTRTPRQGTRFLVSSVHPVHYIQPSTQTLTAGTAILRNPREQRLSSTMLNKFGEKIERS